MMFNSQVEQGKFLSSTDVIHHAFDATLKTSSTYATHKTPSGLDVLVFCRNVWEDTNLVQRHVDFISTGLIDDSAISINEATIELFENLPNEVKELEKKHINSPLVITGWGLGGHLAILSALRLHRAIDVEESNGSKNTKRPICITFGSPLIGGEDLQCAIAKRPQWKSCFLNMVVKKDRVASLFTSNRGYKPFGTFLFCTESGEHAAFEDEKAILKVLDDIAASSNTVNLQMQDYKIVLSLMRRKVLTRGWVNTAFGDANVNPLRSGIILQFKEIGMQDNIPNNLILEMEKKQMKMIRSKNAYEPTKKLNDSKISLTYMEQRDNHYVLLENWLIEDKKYLAASGGIKKTPASLTEDSCFWAHVEEALISLEGLRNKNAAEKEKGMEAFEEYVMCSIEDYSVSQEIFVKGTSFMKWLDEYLVIKGASYAHEFVQCMNNKTIRNRNTRTPLFQLPHQRHISIKL